MRSELRIAITLGDPRGIGPEVTHKALASLPASAAADTAFLLIGPEGTNLPSANQHFHSVGSWIPNDPASAGAAAGRAITYAVQAALAGEVDAVVTAPIEKSAFAAAGYPYPGHTEMLSALAGDCPVAMMMCAERTRLGGSLRVVLATIHLPLSAVPAALTSQLLVQQAALTDAALRAEWGIARPRLALCAVNPHASDGGLFGDEEQRVMAPAVAKLRSQGVDASGPFPADTVFVRALKGEFDGVIAPYHDVGMAAFKTAAFGAGVNVTLGLPFPRTSPDHGTALDIAGQGVADSSSMLEAIELARKLARSRRGSLALTR